MPRQFKFFLFISFLLFFIFYFLKPSSVKAQIFWSTPAKISISTNNTAMPSTVTGPNGYLHTVWIELDPLLPLFNFTGTPNPGIYYSYWNGDAWSTPVRVSLNTDGFAGWPTIAVTSDNKIHVVWEDDSSNPAGSYGRILYSSSTNYGGSWTTPTSVSETLDTKPGSWSWFPHLVSDGAGNLHLVFNHQNDTDYESGQIINAYYTKMSGGSWSSPLRLSVKTDGEQINDTDITIDSSNNPHVVLEEDGTTMDDPAKGIYYTYFNGTSWTTPVKIGPDLESMYPRIILDNANNRHAVWSTPWFDNTCSCFKTKVEYAKSSGGSWTSPITISSLSDFSSWGTSIIDVTSDSSNNVYVGWGERVGWDGNPELGINLRYRKWSSSSGTWGNPFDMRYAYDLGTPFLYKDKWDNQHLAWSEQPSASEPWAIWYSTVPISVNSYTPGSQLDMTLTTGDTLTLPSGALSVPATISAQIGPLPASADPLVTTLPRSYTFRPHGIQFAANKPASAVINYTDAEVIGTDERNLKVYVWDGQTNNWSTGFDTAVNRALNKVTVTLPHFSLYGLMAPKAPKNVILTWRPPISSAELYSAVDGSTLPIKFSLTYEGGALVPAPTNPDDVTVLVRNADYSWTKEYSYGTGADNVRYDLGNNQYILNLHTKELNLPAGKYSVKVFHQGYNWGTKFFQLTEPGKVKGAESP